MATFYHLNGVDGVPCHAALMLDFNKELLSFTYLGKKTLTIPLSEIVDVNIDENTEIRKKSGVGRALVGGVALGPTGAVVGALTAKDKKNVEAVVTITYFPADRVKPIEITLRFDGGKSKLNYVFIDNLKNNLCSAKKSEKVLDYLGYTEDNEDHSVSSVTILDENTIRSLNNDALNEYFHMIQSWFDSQTTDSISNETFEQVRTVLAIIQDETSKRKQKQQTEAYPEGSSSKYNRPSYDTAKPQKCGKDKFVLVFYILAGIFVVDGVIALVDSKMPGAIVGFIMAVVFFLLAIQRKKHFESAVHSSPDSDPTTSCTVDISADEISEMSEKESISSSNSLNEEIQTQQDSTFVSNALKQSETNTNTTLNDEVDVYKIPKVPITLSKEKIKNRPLSELQDIKYSNITPKGKYPEFVVFDVETTGLHTSNDKIIEIAAICFIDGKATEVFHTFVDPEKELNKEAQAINHITEDDIEGAPTIKELLPAFDAFVGSSDIVAHNLEFDLKFIHHAGSTIIDTKRRYFCTYEQAKKILKKPKQKWDSDLQSYEYDYDSDWDVQNHKLNTLCDYYNINNPAEHRAIGDAYATGCLFLDLINDKQQF